MSMIWTPHRCATPDQQTSRRVESSCSWKPGAPGPPSAIRHMPVVDEVQFTAIRCTPAWGSATIRDGLSKTLASSALAGFTRIDSQDKLRADGPNEKLD